MKMWLPSLGNVLHSVLLSARNQKVRAIQLLPLLLLLLGEQAVPVKVAAALHGQYAASFHPG
jgi:hypothetical protein